MKKAIAFAAAAIMTAAVLVSGCAGSGKSSITMDFSDEKAGIIEFNKAAADDFVMGGMIVADEGEAFEFASDLNDDGQVLISMYAVPENQSMEELPETGDSKYEMMIRGKAVQSCTVEPGEYNLKITVQKKATGTINLNVIPAEGAFDEAHRNWFETSTAEEAAKGAGLDKLVDLNGTKTTLGVLGEMGEIKYRYMDGVAQIFCPAAAVEMSVVKGVVPSGNGDLSFDNNTYQFQWVQVVDGQEVTCSGNREGEATKTIWTDGTYNYAITAYGAGGDDDFGLSAEDVETMVKAVMQ